MQACPGDVASLQVLSQQAPVIIWVQALQAVVTCCRHASPQALHRAVENALLSVTDLYLDRMPVTIVHLRKEVSR